MGWESVDMQPHWHTGKVIRQALETDEDLRMSTAFPAGLCGCNSFAVGMCPMQAQDAIEDIDATSDVHSPVDKPPYGQEDKQARSPRDGCI